MKSWNGAIQCFIKARISPVSLALISVNSTANINRYPQPAKRGQFAYGTYGQPAARISAADRPFRKSAFCRSAASVLRHFCTQLHFLWKMAAIVIFGEKNLFIRSLDYILKTTRSVTQSAGTEYGACFQSPAAIRSVSSSWPARQALLRRSRPLS